MFQRALKIDLQDTQAVLLLGPRKSGKTTLLRETFKKATFFDLLKNDLRTQLTINPSLIRERVLEEKPSVVVIDEIQKVPSLLDEIHWCLENTETKFILCGSSARSLKRVSGGILGGRAWRLELFPLTTHEIPDVNLSQVLNRGLLPKHYLSKYADRELKAYVLDYLEEEIRQEAAVRNLPAFSRFLEVAAQMNGELLNYSNVGRDCGVGNKVIREYYQILEDTLLGFCLKPWVKSTERRMIETAKFYLFDPGITRYLKKITLIQPHTFEFGNAFEQFLINDVRAYIAYRELNTSLSFWRTSNKDEVDLIVGNMELAIEFKSVDQIQNKHLKGLRVLKTENNPKRTLMVSLDSNMRKTEDGIEIVPWDIFCKKLWARDWV